MTTHWPCIVIAVFCCLLAVATSASAECARVKWMKSGVISEENPWIPFGAFVTQRDCVAQAQKDFDKFKDDGMLVVTEDVAGGVCSSSLRSRDRGASW